MVPLSKILLLQLKTIFLLWIVVFLWILLLSPISQTKAVISVVTYDNLSSIKKIKFQNGVLLDILPDIQHILYNHRQTASDSCEAGGMLVGYENVATGNFTASTATTPQASDLRSRISLKLSLQHRKLLNQIAFPYGYIGTWHTHPSEIPSPSPVDLKDWGKCIKHNRTSTNALIFIIAGVKGFRVWLCETGTQTLYEGEIV